MNRFSLVPLALIAAANPAAALAQAATAPQTITRAEVATQLDADFAALDANKDGKASRAEVTTRITSATAAQLAEITKRRAEGFAKIDANKDGSISKAEYDAGVPLPKAPPADPAPVLAQFDANKDGSITVAEFRAPTLANFDRFDTNKDGTVSPAEQVAGDAARR